MSASIDPAQLTRQAAGLISDGDSPEYDRGVAELLCEAADLPLADAPSVLAGLRQMKAEGRIAYGSGH